MVKFLGDPEKAKYLNTKLSPKMASWKAMFKFDANTLELIKHSLQWLKRSWTQEYLSKNNRTILFNTNSEIIDDSLNNIQMVNIFYVK